MATFADPDKGVDHLFSKVEQLKLLAMQPDELEPVMSQILDRYKHILG